MNALKLDVVASDSDSGETAIIWERFKFDIQTSFETDPVYGSIQDANTALMDALSDMSVLPDGCYKENDSGQQEISGLTHETSVTAEGGGQGGIGGPTHTGTEEDHDIKATMTLQPGLYTFTYYQAI